MKTLTFDITIHAPVSKVYHTMLSRDTYRQWTAVFDPSSDYEGGWNKGEKIYFFGSSENGERSGMVAEIEENIPDSFVSIRHMGCFTAGQEITSGPEVAEWAGALENYFFTETDGNTQLRVELDSVEQYADHFNETWPRALQKLKELSE
ncbi:SRPBCC domain-containing protein [Sphingobacterium oryzagri]|uniref:SRPBCC domain-containing protein n=1 Tax=Sphingobacterium oryzagri TaxID=3025669 RepID=A0ABY7WHB6_9SPHI|nr:SRPBCC domain-containing protein [Sphingobacterium sp. KACC 22765]WDF67932.1 SRPBCC domain-containing protein [Sphingobacterium sp. KACC 22765]